MTILPTPSAASSFTNPLGMASEAVNPSPEHVSPPASQAIFGSVRANVGECHVTAFEIPTLRLIASLAAREGEKSLHPFPTPQTHPSQASEGNSASSGSSAPPFLIHDEDSDIDPAFLAAWRESQGQTVDAEARR